jgi:hypothetical protein
MKKYLLCLILFLVIILPGCGKKVDVDEMNKTDFVGQIYHSKMMGADAGTIYRYYIYPDGKNYKYVKTSSSITIAGEGKGIKVSSGKITSRKEMIDLDKDVEKDKGEGSTSIVSYFYREKDGIDTRYDSLEALTDRIYNENG